MGIENIVNILVPLIIALLGGSGVSYFMNWKSEKARAKYITEREQQTSLGISIQNQKDWMSLNKEMLAVEKDLWDREREALTHEIDLLKAKIIDQDEIIKEQNKKIDAQARLIEKYLKEQHDMAEEIKILKEQILSL